MIYTVTLNPAVDKELTVPDLAFDTVLRATAARVDVGGKGFNVSRMVAELGGSSVALGFAGGKAGELLRDGLQAAGIATDFVWVNGETRTNVSVVTAVPSHYLKVNEPGPTVNQTEIQALLKKVEQLARPGDYWVLAGSLPPGVPPIVYAQIMQRLHAAGAHVVLDTSGEALRLGCGKRPFLAKPNDSEASALTGLPTTTQTDIIAAARAIQALGVANLVISLGKAGALLATDSGIYVAAAPAIEEKNPIGAGDSLVGGLVWSLSQGDELPTALRWGIAAGAASASQPGTAVGPCALVQKLAQQVVVNQVG
ncbi:MAG: 1-phosphofructokinase [Anaerolineales bacterium]|nr:1-phosphofructokinase [Anaerolineales bacterium]